MRCRLKVRATECSERDKTAQTQRDSKMTNPAHIRQFRIEGQNFGRGETET